MRYIPATEATWDMFVAYAELVGLPLPEAIVHMVVVAYCTEKQLAQTRERIASELTEDFDFILEDTDA